MSNYESQVILRSNQLVEESKQTSSRVDVKKNSKKSKNKTKKNKKSSKTIKRNETEETEHILEDLTPGEGNVLRESEQQIQADISNRSDDVERNNIVPNSIEPNNIGLSNVG